MTVEMPDLSKWPKFVGYRQGSEMVSQEFFQVSVRSLKRWNLTGKIIGGKLFFPTADLMAEAKRRMDEAPAVRSAPAKRAA